ncbi:MAG: phosphoribosylformylglycinamidine cyclo-ligase [Candidatus Methanoliparum thermophilum]|uniref:Phosphoribosylformylglycinamidine cyclo-ligase n=1 Tax=Methanoliparum thermophilum TaxID=2491083 RepID=A0A520KR91_METT2|nr:phosphoribosylformylglycinamidine cyclo-ligase [Candidatus Methanoliparum sp. LAM-1]RZN63874.1 MAG: phosphoribosylformylglycinamidine cyclo-ligase [Candidatus Methanoliparum thermophilum]BDC36396.1 phosphoribosylaminoimidazole synthetase [Candidatus Methanoliparum sp. LAM-1]
MRYKDAGVDIDKAGRFIKILTSEIRSKRKGFGSSLTEIGHYSGLIDLDYFSLAITTDGVGTKIIVANELKKWYTIGIDCVAMNVNDLIAIGATPLALVDYIAIGKIDEEYIFLNTDKGIIKEPFEKLAREIGKGLNAGAKLSNITIVGGETAIIPDLVKGIDLAGTAVGVVNKNSIIDGQDISPGDSIIAIGSNGVHSNGFTLVRKIIDSSHYTYNDMFPDSDKTIGEELLIPTRIYSEVIDIIKEFKVNGLVHITGGGFLNLKRITKYGFDIYDPIEPQSIFKFLETVGCVDKEEMYRTFNMGVGFIMIVHPDDEKKILDRIDCKKIGKVTEHPGIRLNLKEEGRYIYL